MKQAFTDNTVPSQSQQTFPFEVRDCNLVTKSALIQQPKKQLHANPIKNSHGITHSHRVSRTNSSNDARHTTDSTAALQDEATNCSVTEILFPHGSQNQALLYPSLASLTQGKSERWFTWINPPQSVSKSLLRQYKFDLDKVRIIYSEESETIPLMEKLLSLGNSETVICSTDKNVSKAEHSRLETAAKAGKTQGITLN